MCEVQTHLKPIAKPFVPYVKRRAMRMSYSPNLDRSRLRGSDAIEQMAHDFLTFSANAGSINSDDLELLGWTRTQINLHASDARRYANRFAEDNHMRMQRSA
jgi:hypothetical protein